MCSLMTILIVLCELEQRLGGQYVQAGSYAVALPPTKASPAEPDGGCEQKHDQQDRNCEADIHWQDNAAVGLVPVGGDIFLGPLVGFYHHPNAPELPI